MLARRIDRFVPAMQALSCGGVMQLFFSPQGGPPREPVHAMEVLNAAAAVGTFFVNSTDKRCRPLMKY